MSRRLFATAVACCTLTGCVLAAYHWFPLASWRLLSSGSDALSALSATLTSAVISEIAKSPALAAGFAGLLAVPIVAAAACLGSIRRPAMPMTIADERPLAAGPIAKAWLEVEGKSALGIARELIRIGGDEESDVVVEAAGGKGIDAIIRRTPEAEFMLHDLSRTANPAVSVNGTSVSVAMLRDGDRIFVGDCRLTFHRGMAVG